MVPDGTLTVTTPNGITRVTRPPGLHPPPEVDPPPLWRGRSGSERPRTKRGRRGGSVQAVMKRIDARIRAPRASRRLGTGSPSSGRGPARARGLLPLHL